MQAQTMAGMIGQSQDVLKPMLRAQHPDLLALFGGVLLSSQHMCARLLTHKQVTLAITTTGTALHPDLSSNSLAQAVIQLIRPLSDDMH